MIRALLTGYLLALSLSVQAQTMTLEVIPLQHSTVDRVVETLRPMLAPGGTVTGRNNQLIIKTTPGNMAEIKSILAAIDTPLRRLQITVTQDIDSTNRRSGQEVSGRIRSGDASVSRRASAESRGIVISGTDSEGNRIQYNSMDNRANANSSNRYTVQTLEGEPAYIQSGVSVPVQQQNTVITRNGVVVQQSQQYHDVNSGFYVLPRLNGDRVTLMVAPQLAAVSNGVRPTFDIQQVQTTVSGKLGEWLEIGGLQQSSGQGRDSLLSGTDRQQQQTRSILIKVEEIR